MRKRTMLCLGVLFCVTIAAWHFLTAQTAEEAQNAEQRDARQVLQIASKCREEMRSFLNPDTMPEELEEAKQRFLSNTKNLEHLSTGWREDIDRLEILGHQRFKEWRGVINTIHNKKAQATEAANYQHNLRAFHQQLHNARATLHRLNKTLSRGMDIARCMKSRDYECQGRSKTRPAGRSKNRPLLMVGSLICVDHQGGLERRPAPPGRRV